MTPSQEVINLSEKGIRLFFQNKTEEAVVIFSEIYERLLAFQIAEQLRIHKGFPLYWKALCMEHRDESRSIELIHKAFVEDVLTFGRDAHHGSAATVLKKMFGAEHVSELQQFIVELQETVLRPDLVLKKSATILSKAGVPQDSLDRIAPSFAFEHARKMLVLELKNKVRPAFGKQSPRDEYELQSVVAGICSVLDSNVVREYAFTGAGNKEYKVDFALFNRSVALETKLTSKTSTLGKVQDEMLSDISGFGEHFKRTLFLVYDSGGIVSNVNSLKRAIEQNENIKLLVVKH